MRPEGVRSSGPDADRAPASIPLLMQERLVEACLMRGRPARADSTPARGALQGWFEHFQKRFENGGAEGIRTPDPKTASLVLSQLSYSPTRRITLPGSAEDCQGCGDFGTGGGIRTRTPLRAWRFERHVYRQFHHPGADYGESGGGLIVHPSRPRSSHRPRRSVSERPEERFRCSAFPRETGNGRGIVHPAKQFDRLTLCVAQRPQW